MAETFAEKFEKALQERREREPGYGLRTLARVLAEDDPKNTKTILRRLQKYRPKPGSGGAAEVAPTEPTRREIERAMGLEIDELKADEAALAASSPLTAEMEWLEALEPLARLLASKSNAPAAHFEASTAWASTNGG